MKTIILTACLMMVSSCANTNPVRGNYFVHPLLKDGTYYIEYTMKEYGSEEEVIKKVRETAHDVCPEGFRITGHYSTPMRDSSILVGYMAVLHIDCNLGE